MPPAAIGRALLFGTLAVDDFGEARGGFVGEHKRRERIAAAAAPFLGNRQDRR